jgi:hypothetical protein
MISPLSLRNSRWVISRPMENNIARVLRQADEAFRAWISARSALFVDRLDLLDQPVDSRLG